MKQEIIVSESYTKNRSKYKSYGHSVGISMFHIEWCTKYRYKMFGKLKYRNMMAACIRQVAVKHGIKLLELEVVKFFWHLKNPPLPLFAETVALRESKQLMFCLDLSQSMCIVLLSSVLAKVFLKFFSF